ncbi:MAG TPA: hypothetical protein PLF81_04020 [Candidatus Anammoximicrobium sp.]|mgnify:CR=1 FL=1|nr:hypothetical protein [Candidatus Anammoximicrobium sp.]
MKRSVPSLGIQALGCALGVLLLLTGRVSAQGEAYVGQPFGVGLVTLTIPEAAAVAEVDGFALTEANGRTLYPVFTEGRILRLLGEILGDNLPVAAPNVLNVLFLFTGEQPLDLTVHAPGARQFRVMPQQARDVRGHQRLMQRWWREYNALARRQTQKSDYPPIVQTYLTSMLSRRLGLASPFLSRAVERRPSEPLKTMELVLGAENLRLAALRQTNTVGYAANDPADLPVPDEIRWQPLVPPAADEQVDIEPIARHVPEECFYIRFGSFQNYLWWDELQQEYGGDLERMITLRGFDDQAGDRMQRQLALEASPLADLLGPAVISDVALIGRDLFLREGAAVGMLFQARNALLGNDINNQRKAALHAEKANGSRIETVQIAGRDVSFLSTPNYRLRSYYVVDGDYHLVTSSRAIVERFLSVRDGQGSLGASSEFRHARSIMPTSRQDTVFVFFSSAFQQGLLSPQYQIELRRRLQAVTDLELVQLAQLASGAEGRPGQTIADLVRAQLLPPGFGQRPDGSGPTLADGQLVDSLRGPRGSFTPIPDVAVRSVTRGEAARYAELTQFYGGGWKQLDPLMIGIKRTALEGERMERLVIEGHLSPFAEQKYGGITSLLGSPTRVRIRPAEGDVITIQAAVKGGLLVPSIPPHHLFLGVQDNEPLADLRSGGLLDTLLLLQSTPGYLGAWPKLGFLDLLPLGLAGGAPDAAGYSQLPLGVWRRQWDAFSALAFDPKLLAFVTPQLAATEADNDAQVRVHVSDLSQARLQTWVNQLAYSRAHQASLGNAKLLHMLSQQLAVPRDRALDTAEDLLDAKLICSLGGQYGLSETPGQIALWKSDQWPDAAGRPATDSYRAPLLDWFRGLDADLTMYPDRVVVHATLDMQRKATEPKVELPFFNKLFGGGKPKADANKPAVPPPPPPGDAALPEIIKPPPGEKAQP